jgi:hypothetical protein
MRINILDERERGKEPDKECEMREEKKKPSRGDLKEGG